MKSYTEKWTWISHICCIWSSRVQWWHWGAQTWTSQVWISGFWLLDLTLCACMSVYTHSPVLPVHAVLKLIREHSCYIWGCRIRAFPWQHMISIIGRFLCQVNWGQNFSCRKHKNQLQQAFPHKKNISHYIYYFFKEHSPCWATLKDFVPDSQGTLK